MHSTKRSQRAEWNEKVNAIGKILNSREKMHRKNKKQMIQEMKNQ